MQIDLPSTDMETLVCIPEILNVLKNESVIAKIEHGRAGNILRFEEKRKRLRKKIANKLIISYYLLSHQDSI
jgi:hypothetical protein